MSGLAAGGRAKEAISNLIALILEKEPYKNKFQLYVCGSTRKIKGKKVKFLRHREFLFQTNHQRSKRSFDAYLCHWLLRCEMVSSAKGQIIRKNSNIFEQNISPGPGLLDLPTRSMYRLSDLPIQVRNYVHFASFS